MFIIHYKNGGTVTEEQKKWDECEKEGITSIQLKHKNGSIATLNPGKKAYFFQHKIALEPIKTICRLCVHFDSSKCHGCRRSKLKLVKELNQQIDDLKKQHKKKNTENLLNDIIRKSKHLAGFESLPNLYEELPNKTTHQEIGAVYNKKGDCVVLQMDLRTGFFKTYFSNAFELKLNLPLHGITLEGLYG